MFLLLNNLSILIKTPLLLTSTFVASFCYRCWNTRETRVLVVYPLPLQLLIIIIIITKTQSGNVLCLLSCLLLWTLFRRSLSRTRCTSRKWRENFQLDSWQTTPTISRYKLQKKKQCIFFSYMIKICPKYCIYVKWYNHNIVNHGYQLVT